MRAYCARSLDPFVGEDGFDFVADLAEKLPMQVISMLLGIPDSDQEAIRDSSTESMHTEPGQPMKVTTIGTPEMYADYIDWRAANPTDDLMTDLMRFEFEDESGTVRRLTRDEILTYCSLLGSAGNETASRLIGWIGKVLSDHPDQRRELAARPELIPTAVEEVLRFEPPGHNFARWVTRDVELHGVTVPAESIMVFLPPRPTATSAGSTTASASTSIGQRASTTPSATGSTSASARRWLGSRARSPSTRSSGASPTGRWMPPAHR